MACFRPLVAHQERGRPPKVGYPAGYGGMDRLELPCGRCIGCKKDRSRAWSIRVMHEASLYDRNLFLTLDYAPEHLRSWSLQYVDFQKFMRRIRKKFSGCDIAPNGGKPIRFFVAGEYGAQYGRPHWHAILFNFDSPDRVRYANNTYYSGVVEDLWGKGRVVIGDVTPRSAAYVAGYTLSKVYGSAAENHYEDVVNLQTGELTRRCPEFCQMSRDPGIGAWWFERFKRDLFPHDFAVMDSRKQKVPRYYWNKFLEEGTGNVVEDIRCARELRARAVDPAENSERRRADREEVAWSRSRTFEERGF